MPGNHFRTATIANYSSGKGNQERALQLCKDKLTLNLYFVQIKPVVR